MKITIQREILVRSVQEVIKAISFKTTIPILTGIKFHVTEQGLTLTGSDADISIKSFVPKEADGDENIMIEQTGSCVFQARYFYEIVKKLPDTQVQITISKQQNATIQSGKTEFNLKIWDAEEYPRLPEINESCSFYLSVELLKNIIRQTVYAVSTSENRPILTGVNWIFDKETLVCVGTNSHRLAQKIVLQSDPNIQIEVNPFNIVIPGKSLNELNKLLDGENEQVKVVITPQQILFQLKNLLFFSRLLEGNYPDTKKLIPKEMKTKLVVDVKAFHRAIDRASLLSKDEKSNIVKLEVNDSCTIFISSNAPEIGKVEEELSSEHFEGEELKISFSAKYMMDALKVMDDEKVEISFTGAMRPFLIKNISNDEILELVLPVRTY